MLKSMTGHGQACVERDGCTVHAELRCVNSRYFKLQLRVADGYGWLEPRVEALLRSFIQRGSIHATLQVTATEAQHTHDVDASAVRHYAAQISQLAAELDLETGATLVALLQLPGAISEAPTDRSNEQLAWPAIQDAVQQAVHNLDQMRRAEGQSMADDFQSHLATLTHHAELIRQLAPTVVKDYQARLADRLLQLQRMAVAPQDLAREVALFADRCDISEELVRLQSHLRQFGEVLDGEAPAGKKLEFIIQEMFRETNTIGSKASDLTIARHVIELKTTIERMREMVQNVE